LSSDDTLLALSSRSFDIAGMELLLPLSVGARVVLATPEEAAIPPGRCEIADNKITTMQAPPATWRLLLDSSWPGSKSLKALSGGENLSRELADRLLERCAELWNLYGPTETTIWSAVAKIEPAPAPLSSGGLSPIRGFTFWTLSSAGPGGCARELFIGGDGVAPAILNCPESRAGKFVRDPFNTNPAAACIGR